MKPTQLPLIKGIIDQMLSAVREIQGKTNADHVPVIQRVTSVGDRKYLQLVTTVGIVSIADSGKLTELDYPVEDIGPTVNWSKTTKGVISSKSSTVVPIDTAANVAAFADEESWVADKLLFGSVTLPPVSAMLTPGRVAVVFTSDGGRALNWAYDPTASAVSSESSYDNMKSEWTRNVLDTEDIYGIVRAWHRAVAFSFPKDVNGYPSKIDGVAVARVGTRTGIRIVSRELGVVVTMACSHFPKDKVVSYRDLQGALVSRVCQVNGVYYTNKEEKEMNVKMIDISAIQPKAPVVASSPEAEEPKPVQEPVAPAVETSVEPDDPKPVTVVEVKPEAIPEQPKDLPKTVDELFVELTEAQAKHDESAKAIKVIQKAIQKAYKQEIKDLKANAKDNEELVKLRAAHKRLRALLDADL